jgi:uncharacterized protein (UPF0261 family)
MGRIFVVGTADAKGEELAYLRAAVVGFGIGPPRCGVDIAKCGYRQPALAYGNCPK